MLNNQPCKPIELSTEETGRELARFGLTRETAGRPTPLELQVEFEMGRMSYEEYRQSCESYGYEAVR